MGKAILTLLQSFPDIVTFENPPRAPKKNRLYKSLESGLRDVREIREGKQKKVTLDEFLKEL
jgi:predicted metallo-beta-lactamase superfamily hydrolase